MTLGALVASTSPLQAQDLAVTTAVVATGVEDREPVGTGASFSADVQELVFYTVLEGGFTQRVVEHVWVRNGEEVARVPLTVSGPRWRTWSTKTIPEDWTGEWEARIEDADGSVLARAAFQVGG
ncbi:MAG: DUF2914 domain-containing protein [Gemmatimonadota bacterium]